MIKPRNDIAEVLNLFFKFIIRTFAIMIVGLTLMNCGGKEEESAVTFSIGPTNVTALNVKTSNCLDLLSATTPPPTSAQAAVIFLDNLKITWVNTKKDLHFYGVRFFASNSALKGGKAEVMLTGADLASLFKSPAFCGDKCVITRSTSAIPKRTLWIRGGLSAKLFMDDETTSTTSACAPVVGGFVFNSNVSSQVSFPITVTLYAYSVNDEGEINNEYASATLNATYQPPPQ